MPRSILTPKKKSDLFLTIIFTILTILLVPLLVYELVFFGKIYPRIYIADIDVGKLTPPEASIKLSQSIKPPSKLTLLAQGKNFEIKTKDLNLSYDFSSSALRTFNYTRSGNFIYDYFTQLKLLISPSDFGLTFNLDEDKLTKILSAISGQVSKEPINPSVRLSKGNILVDKGSAGSEVDIITLKSLIESALSAGKEKEIEIPIKTIDTTLSDDEAFKLKERAGKFIGKNIEIKFEYSVFSYKDTELINFVNPKGDFNTELIKSLSSDIAKKIEREPQNPKFNFENGRVSEFLPALDGVRLNQDDLVKKFTQSLSDLENSDDKTISIETSVTRTPPEVSTDKVNNLGIKELIGRGTSTFFHSIPSRVHNVVLAASRINGTLVKPGETFSFNNTLGDVSQFTGYQQAYIISGGKTILGDGGGVCQVSTTLFRALLNGGLPINERAAHAYRVGYYEQNSPPGLDATVYGPSPDLKFTNDTPGYILIEATADPKHYSLIFELYGTSDGRVSVVTKPIVSNITPTLPTIYQDDPTLPVGTLKQVDFSAAGAKVTFNYSVKRNGIITYQKTFVSTYRPWAAVYLRGTAVK